ncbi:hypothetical protein PLICRDRAFT_170348 [Plicaturopsis crispa FD-325 SS-3]|nr:hypothetical protein PLICRDRAFT_170348 [Plicaturopsis crispa FD-325 SS-3]
MGPFYICLMIATATLSFYQLRTLLVSDRDLFATIERVLEQNLSRPNADDTPVRAKPFQLCDAENASCTPPSAADLCNALATRRVLIVGDQTSFHLHSILLRAVLTDGTPPHTCLGPEFCTFHHICLPPSLVDDGVPRPRALKLPTRATLASTRSAILRFILSSDLSGSVSRDPISGPVVDPKTLVRTHIALYLPSFRRSSDILVVSLPPIPAPAWTYVYDAPKGNWTFTDSLPRYLGPSKTSIPEAEQIVNAAVHATLETFLPNAIRVLQDIRTELKVDTGQARTVVWHGAWCRDGGRSDPWKLYHDAQVHMQTALLRILLPRYSIPFLPLQHPSVCAASLVGLPARKRSFLRYFSRSQTTGYTKTLHGKQAHFQPGIPRARAYQDDDLDAALRDALKTGLLRVLEGNAPI